MKAPIAAIVACVLCVVGCGRNDVERGQLAAGCAAAGAQAFERYKTDLIQRYTDLTSMLDKPEFHFNSRLNTCLMRVGHWSLIPGTQRRPREQDSDLLDEIIDVYSNKTIISAGHENRYDDTGNFKVRLTGTNPIDFEDKAKLLMVQ